MHRCSCLGNPLSSRRDFLAVGAAGGLGFVLGDLLAWESAQAAHLPGTQSSAARPAGGKSPRAKSILHIFLPGGIAQQESFDPKPYAPLEYRGSFGVVKT